MRTRQLASTHAYILPPVPRRLLPTNAAISPAASTFDSPGGLWHSVPACGVACDVVHAVQERVPLRSRFALLPCLHIDLCCPPPTPHPRTPIHPPTPPTHTHTHIRTRTQTHAPTTHPPTSEQIYVVHHTDCGMVTFTTPQLRQIVKERLGADDATHYHEFRWPPSPSLPAGSQLTAGVGAVNLGRSRRSMRLAEHGPRPWPGIPAGLDPTPYAPSPCPCPRCSDLEQSVRDDVELIRSSPLVLPGTPVVGGIYDVHTGGVRWLG